MSKYAAFCLLFAACAQHDAGPAPPPPIQAAQFDQTGTGLNWGHNGVNQRGNFTCPDGAAPIVGFDASSGDPACYPVGGGGISDAGFSAPPPIGNGTANTLAGTSLAVDSGVTTCNGTLAPNFDSCTPVAAIPVNTWVTIDSYTPSALNQGVVIKEFFIAFDFDGGTGVSAVNGNEQDGYLSVRVIVLPDAGIELEPIGQPTTARAGALFWASPNSLSNCDAGRGCTVGGLQPQWSAQAVADGGVVLVQVATDAGSGFHGSAERVRNHVE